MNTGHNKSDSIIGMQDIIDRTVDAQVSRHVWRSDALNRGGIVSVPSTNRSARLQGLQAMAIGKRKKSQGWWTTTLGVDSETKSGGLQLYEVGYVYEKR